MENVLIDNECSLQSTLEQSCDCVTVWFQVPYIHAYNRLSVGGRYFEWLLFLK